MIKLTNASRLFRTQDVETTALNNINLTVAKGDFLAIMGPSGCGKSTLLSMLGMLDSPNSGDYFFDEENIAKYGERKLSKLRSSSIGFVFQSFNLIDSLTVFENVELPLLYLKISKDERKKRVSEILKKSSD